jgi:hypothetical protein
MHAKRVLVIDQQPESAAGEALRAGKAWMHMRAQARRRGRDGRRKLTQGQFPPEGREAADAVEVARYIGDMTAQMETMASAAKLEMLAHLLRMAAAESEAISRGRDQD